LKWTIGYGLGTGYFRALYWLLALLAVGTATLYLDQTLHKYELAPHSRTLVWMIAASIDSVLPIVSLDTSFSDVIPKELVWPWAKVVFWLLRIAGWILGSFLVAGLAGLTQKSS
jgi:hypothetical protein